ncbi:hypothetical protein [Vallitalea sediminicola]
MNKIGFCLSGIMSLICLIAMLINAFIIGLTPTIGQIVWNFSRFTTYHYKDFLPNFSSSYAISIIFFIISFCLCIMFYIKEKMEHK